MLTCALHLFAQISGGKWSQILHSGTLLGPCYSFSNSQLSNDVNTLHPSSSVSMSFLHFTPFLWNYKNKLKQTWQKWHYGILFLFIVYCILYLKIYQFDIATRLIMHFDWLKFQKSSSQKPYMWWNCYTVEMFLIWTSNFFLLICLVFLLSIINGHHCRTVLLHGTICEFGERGVEIVETRINLNSHWIVPYRNQNFIFCVNCKSKMATIAGQI